MRRAWSGAIESLDDLKRFIDYWAGPRRAGYGIHKRELAKFSLPGALAAFFNYAGRWPGIINRQDHLLPPSKMRLEPIFATKGFSAQF